MSEPAAAGPWAPLARLAIGTAGLSARSLAAMPLPATARLGWLELGNKLRAFALFQEAGDLYRPGNAEALAAAVARAQRRAPNPAVWVTEGIGYRHARWALGRAPHPRGLVASDRLPRRARVPLHTGMGLAMAESALAGLGPESPPPELRRRLAEFSALCRDNSRPGWEGMALEALGLVAHNLHRPLVGALGRELAALDPGLPEYLWHGVGRALYFTPSRSVPWPGATADALDQALADAPDEPARRNAVAGLGWAVTLVNLERPEVVAELLRQRRGALADSAAFSHGVTSALRIWRASAPDDPALDRFLAHRPGGGAVAELWARRVARPGEIAFAAPDGDRPGRLFACPAPSGGGADGRARRGAASLPLLAAESLDVPLGRMVHALVSPPDGNYGPRSDDQVEEEAMPANDPSAERAELARYTLLSVKPGGEKILDRGRMMVARGSDAAGIQARILGRYLRDHPVAAGEEAYLRVYYDVEAGFQPAEKKKAAAAPAKAKPAAKKARAKAPAKPKPAAKRAAAKPAKPKRAAKKAPAKPKPAAKKAAAKPAKKAPAKPKLAAKKAGAKAPAKTKRAAKKAAKAPAEAKPAVKRAPAKAKPAAKKAGAKAPARAKRAAKKPAVEKAASGAPAAAGKAKRRQGRGGDAIRLALAEVFDSEPGAGGTGGAGAG